MRSKDFIELAKKAGFNYDNCEELCPHAIVVCNSLVGSLVGLPTGNTEALDRLGEMIKKDKENHNSRRARVWIQNNKSNHYWWFRVCEYQPA